MKKILLILSVFAITNFTYAQTFDASSSQTKEMTKAETMLKENPKMEKQIKDQLIKNEELSTMAIKHLKSDPETKSTIAKLYSENKGSTSDIMKSVMNDPKLSSNVMNWVTSNPGVLDYAMNLIGM